MLGIYCRISHLKAEGKDRSIKEQQLIGIELATKLNVPYDLFIEEGVSGTLPVEKRPGLERLLSKIENGTINAMFIYLQDRLERNPEVRYYVNRILRENNAKLYTEKGEVDLYDEDADLLGSMESIFNAHSVRKTKKRVRAVLKRNASEGKAHGVLAYGYTKDANGYLMIDNEEEVIIRRIYELSLKGIGTDKIAEILNSEEVPTRYRKVGKKDIYMKKDPVTKREREHKLTNIRWAGNTIRGIIKNPIYKGKRVYRGEEISVPHIFDERYWKTVNENLKNNANNRGRKVRYDYLLYKKIVCGKCGHYYYGRRRANKKDNFYMCSSKRYKHKNCGARSINIDIIEDFIWQRLFVGKVLLQRIKMYFSSFDKAKKKTEYLKLLKGSKAQLKKEKDGLGRIIGSIRDGLITHQEAKLNLAPIRSEISYLENQIEKYEKELEKLENLDVSLKSFNRKLDNIKQYTSFPKKRALVEQFIDKILIIQKDNFHYLFVHFTISEMEDEVYVIPYPNLNYAIETFDEIIIPLSDKMKKLTDEELSKIVVKTYANDLGKIIRIEYDPNTHEQIHYYWNPETGIKELEKRVKLDEGLRSKFI